MRARSRGARLPYHVVAGVEPCSEGWLVVPGHVQGAYAAPQPPEILPSFVAVLDRRPAIEVAAVHVFVGLPDTPRPEGRLCDQEARRLLGSRRSAAVPSAPCRAALRATTYEETKRANGGTLTRTLWRLLPLAAEADREMAPYLQRTVFEANPELSFFNLNGEEPLRWGRSTVQGRRARRTLLEERLPGVERVLDQEVPGVSPGELVDATALLWTARRLLVRAGTRLPADPEWDGRGLRMEIWR